MSLPAGVMNEMELSSMTSAGSDISAYYQMLLMMGKNIARNM
jgi:hypothetical protein